MSLLLFILLVAFMLVCLLAKIAGAGVRLTAWVLKVCWTLFAFICLWKLLFGGAWVAWGILALLGYLFDRR